jgi:cysteine desulfurase/selenocysteine lyase
MTKMQGTPLADVLGMQERVPLADGRLVRYVNLDNAASTPPLAEVWDALGDFMPWYSSVHRGAGVKSRRATDAYEAARAEVVSFFGADPDEHVVIFGKNATEAINTLARCLRLTGERDVVLVSGLEHHSNDLPWRRRFRVEHVAAQADGALDEADLDRLLAVHAGRVGLLAVTGASNVTGHLPRIHELARRAHAAGARILVDAAQLAPHRSIDMRPVGDPGHLDYLAVSAHKMYAPFGSGALIGRRDTFTEGMPDHSGGGTVRYVTLREVTWADSPERDEAGTPNVVGAIAWAAALRALRRIGLDRIAAHEATLVARTLRGMAVIDGVRVYGDADPAGAAGRTGVIPFAVNGFTHSEVAAHLSAEHGIGVRSGCFCAQPYVTHLLGVSSAEVALIHARLPDPDPDELPGLVRVSFGLYNSADDVDRLLGALRDLVYRERRALRRPGRQVAASATATSR